MFVLTDTHNRAGWDRASAEGAIPDNIQVRFLRDRSACSDNRFVAHIQSWLNYSSFNRHVFDAARTWHGEVGFDLCHQVTIAGWRMPSPLWQLPIPFIWGPIGGAGYIPGAFRGMLSPSARLFEFARDVNSWLSLRSKAFKDCITQTAVVFVANQETEELLRPYRHEAPLVRLPIASLPSDKVERFARKTEIPRSGPLRLFAGGNMEGRKGVSIALKALAKVAAADIDFRYTIAGGGPEVPSLKKLCSDLGLDAKVEFHPGYAGDEYVRALQDSDIYFLPSFRESTPVTLLEAYLADCYPIVADTSAQGEIVRLAGGTAVSVESPGALIDGLAKAVIVAASERQGLPMKVRESRTRLLEYFDSSRYERFVEEAYQTAIEMRRA